MPFDKIVLFDPLWRSRLLPLAFTRSVADIRVGVLTIREKWTKLSDVPVEALTQEYLKGKYPYSQTGSTLFVNAAILPDKKILSEFEKLTSGQGMVSATGDLLAINAGEEINDLDGLFKQAAGAKEVKATTSISCLKNCWDIFAHNGQAISNDIVLMELSPSADRLSGTNRFLHPENIYTEEGAKAEFAIFNASAGPIYLGRKSEVMEGAVIRGAFALGDHSQVKMAAKIYGDTTIGPYSKVGGEISNSVIFGYSNKAHDGFLGNSVVGEWCNLGADTNNSNLKNNYSTVKAYNYAENGMIDTGLQFCGLIMGDHSKCGINTMFNTGTVAGVSANIFGGGFPPKFIPSFFWGGLDGYERYALAKAMDTADKVMQRRGLELSETDRKIFEHIFSEESRHFA